jgi:hypothetical protein
MKFYSILTLFVFINFTALPSIAVLFGFELPSTNVIIQEEENHSSSFTMFEKSIPKTLDINDFLKFVETKTSNTISISNSSNLLDPHLTIFSPPPEA